MEKKLFKRKDILIVLLPLILAAVLFACICLFSKPGKVAVVIVDGKEVASLPLDTDTEYVVCNHFGKNVVVVKDGKVSVSEADCPKQVCVNTGTKNKAGDAIICVAHKLVVEVRDEER